MTPCPFPRARVVLSLAALLLAAPAAPGAEPDWRTAALAAVRRAEYEARPAEGGYQAVNRAQGLRASFGRGGLTIAPRGQDGWSVALVVRSLNDRAVGQAGPSAQGPRVEYRRGALREWYLNDERGLEQGFTLDEAPDPAGDELRLLLDVESPGLRLTLAGDGRALAFEDEHGQAVLSYSGLRSWDADGRELPSRMVVEGCDEPSSCRLALVVDTRGARYPVTVDPLLSASWTFQPDQDGALVGSAVAAGDVNGDGFSDVVVGASSYDGGQADEGRAYVFYGSAAGPAAAPSWIEECDQASAGFGSAVAVGDVNGDGYADVAVGAPFFDNGQTDEGRVFVCCMARGQPLLGDLHARPFGAVWQDEPYRRVRLAMRDGGRLAPCASCDDFTDENLRLQRILESGDEARPGAGQEATP